MTLRHIKRDELYGILNCLKQFQVLRELELDVNDFDNIERTNTQIQLSVITLAQNLSHLENIDYYVNTLGPFSDFHSLHSLHARTR